jgi:RNA polymerase sigma-70 factor, ECF subfamily
MHDEPALLQAAKRLDVDTLITIFDRYAPAIYQFVYRICHDERESDNIVGDTFYALLEQYSAGKGPHINIRIYLFQTAYHLVVDHARHIQYLMDLESIIEMPLCLKVLPTEIQVDERVLLKKLLSAMNHDLSELQRHVIILRFLEGFSLQETATIIGKNANHIKAIQHGGITRLRRSLCLLV